MIPIVRESIFEFEKESDPFKSLRIGNMARRKEKYDQLQNNNYSHDQLMDRGFTPEEIEMFSEFKPDMDVIYFHYAKKTKKIRDLENFYNYLKKHSDHFSSIYSLEPHKFDDPKRAREIAREIILKDAKNETRPYTKGISKFFDRAELPVYFPHIEEFKDIDVEKEKGRTNLRNKSEEEASSGYSNAVKIIESSNYGQITSTPLQIKNGTIQYTTINGNKFIIQSSGYVRKIAKGSERAAVINYDNQLSYEEMAQIALNRINKEKNKSGVKESINFERTMDPKHSMNIGVINQIKEGLKKLQSKDGVGSINIKGIGGQEYLEIFYYGNIKFDKVVEQSISTQFFSDGYPIKSSNFRSIIKLIIKEQYRDIFLNCFDKEGIIKEL